MTDGAAPFQVIDGIRCYAPEIAHGSGGFPTDTVDDLYRAEEAHAWFRARNRVIRRLFARHLGLSRERKVLEVGCGNGSVLAGLSSLPNLRLTGAEAHIEALRRARQRLRGADLVQLDAMRMPFEGEFDAVGAFDVLEHVEEDEVLLANLRRALVPGGLLFVSVPQHPWLWSAVDDLSCHKRRYTRSEMIGKLERAGFHVLRWTSFATAPLPVLSLARRARRRMDPTRSAHEQLVAELHPGRAGNLALAALLAVDELLIAIGLPLPAGGSLLVVAERPIRYTPAHSSREVPA